MILCKYPSSKRSTHEPPPSRQVNEMDRVTKQENIWQDGGITLPHFLQPFFRAENRLLIVNPRGKGRNAVISKIQILPLHRFIEVWNQELRLQSDMPQINQIDRACYIERFLYTYYFLLICLEHVYFDKKTQSSSKRPIVEIIGKENWIKACPKTVNNP